MGLVNLINLTEKDYEVLGWLLKNNAYSLLFARNIGREDEEAIHLLLSEELLDKLIETLFNTNVEEKYQNELKWGEVSGKQV